MLEAGTPQRPAKLTMESSKTPGQPPQHVCDSVRAQVDLIRRLQQRLAQRGMANEAGTVERDNRRACKQDLFVFTDAAKFEDKKSDYWLKGDVLKLWLESQEPAAFAKLKVAIASPAPNSGSRSPKPSHVQAVGTREESFRRLRH